MRVYVTSNGNTIVYGLNGSQAAKDLYAQLPLTIEVEDYSTNEKYFTHPESLMLLTLLWLMQGKVLWPTMHRGRCGDVL